METLYIEAASIECNEERREISGKIVPMGTGEIGKTNLGAYTFAAGSIDIDDSTKIRLLSMHDMKKPVGRMVSAETREDGIYATFKLSRSTGGNDALVMAQEGLVTGLSIGAEIISSSPSRDGYTVVTSAKLKEVSLVTLLLYFLEMLELTKICSLKMCFLYMFLGVMKSRSSYCLDCCSMMRLMLFYQKIMFCGYQMVNGQLTIF